MSFFHKDLIKLYFEPLTFLYDLHFFLRRKVSLTWKFPNYTFFCWPTCILDLEQSFRTHKRFEPKTIGQNKHKQTNLIPKSLAWSELCNNHPYCRLPSTNSCPIMRPLLCKYSHSGQQIPDRQKIIKKTKWLFGTSGRKSQQIFRNRR